MRLNDLVRAAPTRQSRLHTGRGELAPPRVWPELPLAAFERATGGDRRRPWLTRGAVRRIRQLLDPSMVMLELGGGYSTAWFADRVRHVTTVESSPDWARTIRAAVGGRANAEVVDVEDVAGYVDGLAESFDVVMVDNYPLAGRPELVRRLLPATRRFMIHDDSDAEVNQLAAGVLDGWTAERYVGVKSHPLAVVETSLYRR